MPGEVLREILGEDPVGGEVNTRDYEEGFQGMWRGFNTKGSDKFVYLKNKTTFL